MYTAKMPHICSNNNKITDNHKDLIIKCVLGNLKTNPVHMNTHFRNYGLNELSFKCISNLVGRLKNKIFYRISSYEEYLDWCKFQINIPISSEDQPRVIAYECIY